MDSLSRGFVFFIALAKLLYSGMSAVLWQVGIEKFFESLQTKMQGKQLIATIKSAMLAATHAEPAPGSLPGDLYQAMP